MSEDERKFWIEFFTVVKRCVELDMSTEEMNLTLDEKYGPDLYQEESGTIIN